jgi:hypothetical protein
MPSLSPLDATPPPGGMGAKANVTTSGSIDGRKADEHAYEIVEANGAVGVTDA